jgi:Flp pilus assembly protein TadG
MRHPSSNFCTRILKSFYRNEGGTIAVIFGMSAIPIAIAVSIAVDMANSSEVKSHLASSGAGTRLSEGLASTRL